MKTVELIYPTKLKVLTPIPYTVSLAMYSEEDKKDVIYRLSQSVKFLRNCIKVLGISKKDAIDMELTLNKYTGDKLKSIAANNKNISHDFYMLIANHDW